MSSDLARRVALLHLAEDEGAEQTYQDWLKEQPPAGVVNPISDRVTLRVKSKLGPNVLPFFDLYGSTRAMLDGAPPPEGGLVEAWKSATKLLTRAIASKLGDRKGPELINSVYDRMATIRPFFRKMESGFGIQSFRSAGEQLGAIISDVCRAAGVTVALRPGLDAAKWPLIRKATEKEEQLDTLRIENPSLYAQIVENKEKLRQREIQISEDIQRAGMLPTKTRIQGRFVNIGVDPTTNERMVFTNDGRVLGVKQFSKELLANRAAETRSLRIFPNGLPKGAEDLSLDGIRTLSDEGLADPSIIPPGQELGYSALTDDLSPEEGMRIYPTMKDAKGRPVCVGGRFRGVYMDDLVNRAGRLIEGAAYDFDMNGKRVKFETKNANGSPNITVRKEPYVTVLDDGRFMIKIPYKVTRGVGTDPFKTIRQELDRLGKPTVIPTIEKVEGTMNTTFTFHAKDFAAVRKAVGGMVVSKGASDALKTHFDQIARQERALGEEATKNFSLARIGGFKVKEKIDPATGAPMDPVEFEPDLFTKQKQAISWVESRGYSGLVALDTGIGKCVRHDTLISTDRGLVPIRDMNPGLSDPDTQAAVQGWSVLVEGERLPVIAFYYAGLKPTIKVRTRNGYEIEGSRIHPVKVRRSSGEEFVRTPDLKVGDFLCIERRDGDFPDEEPKLRIPCPENQKTKVFQVPDRMNPDLARLLGYIVAEGWVAQDRFFTISQDPTINPETNEDIISLSRSQFSYEIRNADEKDKEFSSKFLRTYLEWMGVDYTLSADKCIPPVVLRSTRESVIGFIRAYVDAEGSICESGLEVSSASERLLRELQVLFLRLGIVSSRRPKKVRGYDHTYWRLMVTGDNLRRYQDVVGMISSRKAMMLKVLCDRLANTNTDVTPHAIELVEALRTEIFIRAGGSGKGGGLNKRFGNAFVHTLTHIRQGRRNPSASYLKKMLDVAEQVGASDTGAYLALADHVSRRYFYDPIETITEGFCEVMDITVDDPRHTFIGNGVVNHNTLTCIATMKKMERDGFAAEGSRFLYVCPTKLRGNFTRQARAFLEDAGAFLSRVDVLSYNAFAQRLKENPNFGSIKGDRAAGIPPYAAVFFDEAQILVKNEKSKASLAAQKLKHPRKILLTASPMEESPDELYVGVAITNNVNLDERVEAGQISPAVIDMMRFRKRFCQTVGGRTLGLRPSDRTDPTKTEDFFAWAKASFFAANKRDVIEKPLPELRQETRTLQMDPEVELAYRATARKVANVLKAAFAVYRDKGKAKSDEVKELFGIRLKKHLTALNNLANMPGLLIPGARSPKVDASVEVVQDRISRGVRSLLFTDTPDFAIYTATELSARIPTMLHGVALSGKILVFQNGREVAKYTERKYIGKDGQEIAKTEWASFVLQEILGGDPQVASLTLTSTYTLGQNLQMFSTVVQLDRDSFSSEMMKQRTARAWRTGQDSAVDEITLDMAYGDTNRVSDSTLDELRKAIQEVQENLFNEIVGKSQSAAIGKEWLEMGNVDSSLVAVSRRLLERVLAPYPALMGEQEAMSDEA